MFGEKIKNSLNFKTIILKEIPERPPQPENPVDANQLAQPPASS